MEQQNNNGPVVHRLKTWPNLYHAMKSGAKTFDIRRNDRNFQEGEDRKSVV